MKVKCIRQQTAGPGKKTEGWISIGEEYNVLAIYIDAEAGILLRLIADDNFTPALFPGDLFQVSSVAIPRNWIVIRDDKGTFRFSPKPWLEPGFWDKFFDRDPISIEVFERERKIATEGGQG